MNYKISVDKVYFYFIVSKVYSIKFNLTNLGNQLT